MYSTKESKSPSKSSGNPFPSFINSNNMKNIAYKLFSLSLLFVAALPAMAQPPAPPATPIDGGLSLLLGAGAMYGAKKVYDKRKKNQ